MSHFNYMLLYSTRSTSYIDAVTLDCAKCNAMGGFLVKKKD